nr:hypothetical protein [uncultured Pseudoxanthomonas sp.]
MSAWRRCVVVPLAVACLLAAAPAWATTYYYCYLENPYEREGYVYTPIMQTPLDRIDESETSYRFYEFASHLVTHAGSIRHACSTASNPEAIRKWHASHVANLGGILAEWHDPPIPSAPLEDDPPMAALVVEPAEPLVVPPEELAARALAEERRRATARAKVLAENARRDAELDAQLQNAIQRAKRRGRMQ